MSNKKHFPPYHCNICDGLLSEENWPIYLKSIPNYRCRKCNSQTVNRYHKYTKRLNYVPMYKLNKRKIVLEHYSNNTMKCNCCGESIERFLTIDHINNDGAKHRKEYPEARKDLYKWLINNNFPSGFQVLCFNCNCGKSQNGGICPHKNII